MAVYANKKNGPCNSCGKHGPLFRTDGKMGQKVVAPYMDDLCPVCIKGHLDGTRRIEEIRPVRKPVEVAPDYSWMDDAPEDLPSLLRVAQRFAQLEFAEKPAVQTDNGYEITAL